MYVNKPMRKRLVAEINVVPYIDVMLVLLVIFMVTVPLLQQGVEIDLPKVHSEPIATEERTPLILSVTRDGRYYLNLADDPSRPISASEIRRQVMAQLQRDPHIPVLVKADQQVHYGVVMRAMVLLQRAGAEKVGLLTEAPP